MLERKCKGVVGEEGVVQLYGDAVGVLGDFPEELWPVVGRVVSRNERRNGRGSESEGVWEAVRKERALGVWLGMGGEKRGRDGEEEDLEEREMKRRRC